MKKQLKLPIEKLLEIGFVRVTHRVYNSKFQKVERISYEIQCLNGCFYYNPLEDEKVWYQKITIGDYSNDINLDIQKLPELYTVLSAFKVPYNLILN